MVEWLRERHDELERRLAELERHLSLTPDEQLERARLKKEKLRTKDELRPGDPAPARPLPGEPGEGSQCPTRPITPL